MSLLYSVYVTAEAYYGCMCHALSTDKEEIMGLLIGESGIANLPSGSAIPAVNSHDNKKTRDNSLQNGYRITCIYDLALMTRSDKKSDRVEIPADQLHLASLKASKLAEDTGKNIRVVGWYHSHPHFNTIPSNVDLRTQSMYQVMDPDFVGLIISCFNSVNGTDKVQIRAFQADGGRTNTAVTDPVFVKEDNSMPHAPNKSISNTKESVTLKEKEKEIDIWEGIGEDVEPKSEDKGKNVADDDDNWADFDSVFVNDGNGAKSSSHGNSTDNIDSRVSDIFVKDSQEDTNTSTPPIPNTTANQSNPTTTEPHTLTTTKLTPDIHTTQPNIHKEVSVPLFIGVDIPLLRDTVRNPLFNPRSLALTSLTQIPLTMRNELEDTYTNSTSKYSGRSLKRVYDDATYIRALTTLIGVSACPLLDGLLSLKTGSGGSDSHKKKKTESGYSSAEDITANHTTNTHSKNIDKTSPTIMTANSLNSTLLSSIPNTELNFDIETVVCSTQDSVEILNENENI